MVAFHSTPARARGARGPQAVPPSVRAATVPAAYGRPSGAGVWICAIVRLPAPRQVSARVHSQAASPAPPGSGWWANSQAFTARTPSPRAAGSWQAVRAQAVLARGAATSPGLRGGPYVSRAGVSSPRSVSRWPPIRRAGQVVHFSAGCGVGTAVVIPLAPIVTGRSAASGLTRSVSRADFTQGAVRYRMLPCVRLTTSALAEAAAAPSVRAKSSAAPVPSLCPSPSAASA